MNRIALCLCIMVCGGCSSEPIPNVVDRGSDAEVEDGGTVKNPDREKTEAFFVKLAEVQSVEQEKKLLTEFGEWLDAKDYRVKVEVKNDKHHLSCPYFPPVTPWASHSFLDIKNLKLLPRLDNGG